MSHPIRTVELIGWTLDEFPPRPAPLPAAAARALVAARAPYRPRDPRASQATRQLREALERHRGRTDLQHELHGLDWTLGVVDLRCLLSVQRRLSFRSGWAAPRIPAPDDWPALLALAFPQPVAPGCAIEQDTEAGSLTLTSENPNLQVRLTGDPAAPLAVHTGGPFVEVAAYRGRWFLRDGYHRAALLLGARLGCVPAVILQARSLKELGAGAPWFFPESVLFGPRPPQVTDFLDPALTAQYLRPATQTAIRITIETTLTPVPGEHP